MKLAGVLCVMTVLVVSLRTGDGAPQWRPQGRFGKRLEPAMPLLLDQNAASNSFLSSYQDRADKVNEFKVLLHKLCSHPGNFGLYPCSFRRRAGGADNSLQSMDLKR
ncbi:uncharacterized protein LOC121385561 isoform X2 [Gigantopelta aegis]|nr:uncharacterized protein LOC121385561 isoform X2 [Gigantopelta aegis]XP_041372218.1 uncharacterized protein LOC121385561 isoform X2 [Gigantopelta aegis]